MVAEGTLTDMIADTTAWLVNVGGIISNQILLIPLCNRRPKLTKGCAAQLIDQQLSRNTPRKPWVCPCLGAMKSMKLIVLLLLHEMNSAFLAANVLQIRMQAVAALEDLRLDQRLLQKDQNSGHLKEIKEKDAAYKTVEQGQIQMKILHFLRLHTRLRARSGDPGSPQRIWVHKQTQKVLQASVGVLGTVPKH